jgi:hypothetical protein
VGRVCEPSCGWFLAPQAATCIDKKFGKYFGIDIPAIVRAKCPVERQLNMQAFPDDSQNATGFRRPRADLKIVQRLNQ